MFGFVLLANEKTRVMKKIFLLVIISVLSSVAFAQEEPKLTEREQQLLEEREALKKELEEMRKAQEQLMKEQEKFLEKLQEKERAKRIEEKTKLSEEEIERIEKEAEREAEKALREAEELRRLHEPKEVETTDKGIVIPEIPEIPETPEAPNSDRKSIIIEENGDGTHVKVLGVEVKENGDSTLVKVGKRVIVSAEDDDVKVLVRDKDGDRSSTSISFFGGDRNRVFQGFEFGFIGLSYDKSFDTDVPDDMKYMEMNIGRSINWAINPLEIDVRLINEHVKFSTGLGYNVKNFSFDSDYFLVKADNDSIIGVDSEKDLKKNRLRVGYMSIPAMLYFNTHKNPEDSYRIGIGVQGGLKLYQTYRTKYFEDDHKIKSRQNGGWNTRDLILDGRATIGYGPINIYASYSFASLFKNDKGPEVYPYMIGVSFVNLFD